MSILEILYHSAKNNLLYLDPSSGSILLQMLLAALLGLGLAIKIYWRKIVAFFKRSEDNNLTDDEKQS